MDFNPNEHMRQMRSKEGSQEYLDVKWRLVWFREQCPQGTIETEEIIVDLDREMTVEVSVWNNETRRSEKVQKTAKGYARFKAVVTDGKGGSATATGSECAADFSEYTEKAETKAVGRALAYLGFGTQFAPELNEEHRIVDAPIVRTEPKHSSEAASVKDLQKQCNSLFGVGFWQTMLHKALKSDSMDVPILDAELTDDKRIIVQKYLDYAKAQQQRKAS